MPRAVPRRTAGTALCCRRCRRCCRCPASQSHHPCHPPSCQVRRAGQGALSGRMPSLLHACHSLVFVGLASGSPRDRAKSSAWANGANLLAFFMPLLPSQCIHTLPTAALVGLVWARRHIGRPHPFLTLLPLLPLELIGQRAASCQREGPRRGQRLGKTAGTASRRTLRCRYRASGPTPATRRLCRSGMGRRARWEAPQSACLPCTSQQDCHR